MPQGFYIQDKHMKISQVYLNQKHICQEVANKLHAPLISLEQYGSKFWDKAEQGITFAIYEDDAPIAFLVAQNHGTKTVELISIAVDAEKQKQGLAKQLLEKLEEYAEENERPYLIAKLPPVSEAYFVNQGFDILMEDDKQPLYIKALEIEEQTDIAYEGDIY